MKHQAVDSRRDHRFSNRRDRSRFASRQIGHFTLIHPNRDPDREGILSPAVSSELGMDQLPPRWHLNGSLHGISPNFLGRAGCNPGAASFPADWLDPSRGWRRVMLRRNRVRIPGLRPGSPTDQVDGLPSLNLWSPPSSTNASTSEIGTEGVCQVQTCEQELLRERVAVWQLLERRVAANEPSSDSARTTTAVSISFPRRKGLSRPYHRTELRPSKAVSWPRKRLPPPKTRRANLLRPPSVASKPAPRRRSRQDSGTRDGDSNAAA